MRKCWCSRTSLAELTPNSQWQYSSPFSPLRDRLQCSAKASVQGVYAMECASCVLELFGSILVRPTLPSWKPYLVYLPKHASHLQTTSGLRHPRKLQ